MVLTWLSFLHLANMHRSMTTASWRSSSTSSFTTGHSCSDVMFFKSYALSWNSLNQFLKKTIFEWWIRGLEDTWERNTEGLLKNTFKYLSKILKKLSKSQSLWICSRSSMPDIVAIENQQQVKGRKLRTTLKTQWYHKLKKKVSPQRIAVTWDSLLVYR